MEGKESYSSLIGELLSSISQLAKSEIALARLEAQEVGPRLVRHGFQMFLFGGLAMAGAFCLLAFLVIGLGDLLEGRYWLSALIVGSISVLAGSYFARRIFHRIKERDLVLPVTRESLSLERKIFMEKAESIRNAVTRRAV